MTGGAALAAIGAVGGIIAIFSVFVALFEVFEGERERTVGYFNYFLYPPRALY